MPMLSENHLQLASGCAPEPAVAAAPSSSWRIVPRCPACGSAAVETRAALPDRQYVFAGERIPLPDGGVAVAACACGLHYKTVVPAPGFLASLLRRNPGAKWLEHHDYSPEITRLQDLADAAAFDLIDIGTAGGELLGKYADSGSTGRRSALDVMRYPGVDAHLDGEFIEGFLDDPAPAWSGVPYDVATLFDVLEHLYDPATAFANLGALVRKDGLVFIETGNTGSYWPRRFGVQHWWYARLIEHHVFWCRGALAAAADRHGFDVVSCREVCHKSRREMSLADAGVELLKVGLYRISPRAYPDIAAWFGREGNQPWHPFTRDHLQVCLRKR